MIVTVLTTVLLSRLVIHMRSVSARKRTHSRLSHVRAIHRRLLLREGLVLFANQPYNTSASALGSKQVHLTNAAVARPSSRKVRLSSSPGVVVWVSGRWLRD